MHLPKIIFFILLFIITGILSNCQDKVTMDYKILIEQGEFRKAKSAIKDILDTNSDLTEEQKKELKFEIERMDRIRKDFRATENDVVEFIKAYIPNVTAKQIVDWENEKSLEMRYIDGEKRYFKYAARNLFRINKECKVIWQEYHKDEKAPERLDLDAHNKKIMALSAKASGQYVHPVRLRVKYSITVDKGIVPAGETIRCWIPFPREVGGRQTDLKYLGSNPEAHILAPPDQLQRTIHFEKTAAEDGSASFTVEYEFTNRGIYVDIDPDKVKKVDPNGPLAPFLAERSPHIVFTDKHRELSKMIVGDETNPYLIAKKIYRWIDENIPWASAREYSTIPNISLYSIENMHGDCGIKALTFITLLRLNGIPARWQSGWEFQPPHHNMHDWGMVYFEPYGWMPMDVDYGMRKTDDEKFQYFYLSGMDSYRLIFNDEFSQPFYPQKKHFRSETIDSQRGEVEWDGGNLYFDQWGWDIEWMVLNK